MFSIFTIAVVLLIFYGSILRYGVNIPYLDDYFIILDFLNKCLHSPHVGEKVMLISAQWGEHRPAFTKVVSLMLYGLTGEINFKVLMFIGDLSFVGLLILFYKTLPKENRLLAVLPVAFVLFQPQFYGYLYFAMASLGQLWVLTFAFLSVYFVTKEQEKDFLLAIFFMLLSFFTNANGFLVFPIGLIPLVMHRKHKRTFIWFISGIITLFLYFGNYHIPTYVPYSFSPATIRYFFRLVGSGIKPSIFIGILFFLYFLYLVTVGYVKKNSPIFLFLLFVMISILLLSFGRGEMNHFSIDVYKIYSVLLLVLYYVSVIDSIHTSKLKIIFPILLSLSVMFNAWSYQTNNREIVAHRDFLKSELAKLENGVPVNPPEMGFENLNIVFRMATTNGYYRPFHQ